MLIHGKYNLEKKNFIKKTENRIIIFIIKDPITPKERSITTNKKIGMLAIQVTIFNTIRDKITEKKTDSAYKKW